jgi:hypothetical protein
MPKEEAAAPTFLPLDGRHTAVCGRSRVALVLRCWPLLLLLVGRPASSCTSQRLVMRPMRSRLGTAALQPNGYGLSGYCWASAAVTSAAKPVHFVGCVLPGS